MVMRLVLLGIHVDRIGNFEKTIIIIYEIGRC